MDSYIKNFRFSPLGITKSRSSLREYNRLEVGFVVIKYDNNEQKKICDCCWVIGISTFAC